MRSLPGLHSLLQSATTVATTDNWSLRSITPGPALESEVGVRAHRTEESRQDLAYCSEFIIHPWAIHLPLTISGQGYHSTCSSNGSKRRLLTGPLGESRSPRRREEAHDQYSVLAIMAACCMARCVGAAPPRSRSTGKLALLFDRGKCVSCSRHRLSESVSHILILLLMRCGALCCWEASNHNHAMY